MATAAFFNGGDLDNKLYIGECNDGTDGKLLVSGDGAAFSIDANGYCTDISGDELMLSGGYAVEYENVGDYSLTFNQSVIAYDSFDADIIDISAVINEGSIVYSEAGENNSTLAVDASITSGGIDGEFDFTQSCEGVTCSIDANISGAGNDYTVDGLTVILSNGYKGSADIFYNEALGDLAVSFDQIQYCEDGSIASGTMNIIEKDGTAEIVTSFTGCDGFDPSITFYAEGAPTP